MSADTAVKETRIRKTGPLEGLRVIDLGMLFAGPMVATHLGDIGADVIKVEHPKGDDVRTLGRVKDGEALWWRVTARNKKLMSADVSRPEGAEIVKRLVRTADVFIENFRPGRLAKWGLDYKTMSALNPGLVMLHLSGYGQTGPYRERPGLGTLAEGFSGYAHVTGEPNGPPTLPQFPVADLVAALTGTYAVLAALFERSRNGGIGDEIDVSLYEPLLALSGPMIINYDQLGFVTNRRGNRSNWSIPRNAYMTRDKKWVAVAGAANSAALRLFRAIGRDDMADDPGLATNPLRAKRIDEVDGVIAKWIEERSLDEVLSCFAACDVLAGPINDVEQILADPHVKARGTVVKIEDPKLGTLTVQNVVPRFTRNPGRIRWVGKSEVGADTESLLGELGYGNEEIERLAGAGIIKLRSSQ